MMFPVLPLKSTVSAVLSLALIACTATGPGRPTPPGTEAQQAIEAILAPWVSDSAPGVAVAVSKDGEIVFARGAGMANLEHGEPITPDSVFQVASVSKQFTAFATLLLVSEGKIGLDDDIRTYIPQLAEHPVTVTIRHLLNHMGGLREVNTLAAMAGWLDDDIQTHAQLMELVTRQRGVNFAAGARVEYSNTGYMLLAEIVSRVSGMPFEQFTRERIFAPLGMTNTRFKASRNDLVRGRASSYFPATDGFRNVVAAGESTGSTGLYTTALDLLKWTENFQARRVGEDIVFDLMEKRAAALDGEDATFAKGQEQRQYKGLETWSHGGRDAGYRSFLLRVPAEGFAVAVLSNRTDFDTARLAFAVVDAFLSSSPFYRPDEPENWEPASSAQLKSYAGHYEMYPGVIFTISADSEGLKFAALNAPENEYQVLPQIGRHRFLVSPAADISIAFHDPVEGQSPGFSYTIGLHGTLKGRRVELAPFDPATVELSDYLRTCESPELAARYVFSISGDTLFAKHPRRPAFALAPYQVDAFTGEGPLQEIIFTRDRNGNVSGLRASASLADDVTFRCTAR
ncbi:serine hydrolase domain-containing protein [Wenzhouxiangella sp. XN24]|uniref:serine hydrolase domain-containing protein n=1 Tax=Wenzhouxiangella sp. XN24 TaxID=2713569 RepID=UPI0013EBA3F7|nr:serine hydrolase domain-containing protein [Wenzhouxiangella sp. XN24]NGX17144.1 beta-lactamase family protein [Wenzhouxiangella sp. XN24]